MHPPHVSSHTLLPPSSLYTYKQTHPDYLWTPTPTKSFLYWQWLPKRRRLTLTCVGSEVKVHGWCLVGSMVLCVSSYRLPVIQGYGRSCKKLAELWTALYSAKPWDWNLSFHIEYNAYDQIVLCHLWACSQRNLQWKFRFGVNYFSD